MVKKRHQTRPPSLINTNENARKNTSTLAPSMENGTKQSGWCIRYDTAKRLENETEGRKFLYMKRTDEGMTMHEMSPLLLQKVIGILTIETKKC
jgi:hypothetical protein